MLSNDNSAALRNLSALVDFSNLINSSLEIDFALNNLLLTCLGKFQTTRGLIVFVGESGILAPRAFKGLRQEKIDSFPELNLNQFESSPEFEEFKKENKLTLCKKLDTSNSTLGLLLLGEKFTKQPYTDEDEDFLKTIVNIGTTAIENSIIVEKLKFVNRDLDSKVNQLSSLFDLSKEFSGILKKDMVTKLLTYSIIGQLFVTKYAVVSCSNGDCELLENKFDGDKLRDVLAELKTEQISENLQSGGVKEKFPQLAELGVELLIPMLIKGETKGMILLGVRRTGIPFANSDVEFAASVGGLAIISIENARLFEEALEKQRLEKDLELARNIQQHLLPDKIPALENFEIAAFNNSAKQVGGDYYDVLRTPDGRTVVAIADVSGKGVQGALLMANCQAFLHSICKQNINIVEASNLINDLVSENTIDGRFITFFWAVIDDENKTLHYVNAGHNPPLLVRGNELIKLKKGGMILGVLPTMIPYESETIQMESGDTILLFTDGVTEAMDPELNEFSDEKLEELALQICDAPAADVLDKVVREVHTFTRGAEQSDDITMLVVKSKF